MVTQVQLGNFFSANGRTVLGGVGGSGLDTEGLIKTLTEAKGLPAVKLEDKIELNGKRSEALNEFKTLLDAFRDAANFLRNPPGVGNSADNVFRFAKANITSNTSVPGSTYLNVTVAPGTSLQTYTIDSITSIARAKQQTTNTFAIADENAQVVYAAPGPDQFGDGNITVNGQVISLAIGDSLQTVVNKFNAVSTGTGISTTILKVATGQYRIVYSATSTGTTADFNLTPPSATVPADPDGVFTNIVFNTTQAAANATFSINGNSITRQSNSIADAITGLTFNLLAQTPGGTTLTVDVKPDVDLVKSGILNFVNAYNEFKTFAAEQQQLNSDGTTAEDAVLASNSTLRSTINSVNNQLASIVAGITGTNPNRLSDIGITFADLPATEETPLVRNIMTVDEGKLTSALQSNFSGVRKVFEFDSVIADSNIRVFSRTNALAVTDFTLTLNPGTGTYQATYNPGGGPVTINLTGTAISGGGTLLKGQAGTVLEGLVMVYSSAATTTSTVHISQGIGDKVYNVANNVLLDDTGAIDVELKALEDSTAKLEKDIDRINEAVEEFRDQLLTRFGALEKAIAQVNNLLQALDAQAQARNSS